jgi:hypothetical protein
MSSASDASLAIGRAALQSKIAALLCKGIFQITPISIIQHKLTMLLPVAHHQAIPSAKWSTLFKALRAIRKQDAFAVFETF